MFVSLVMCRFIHYGAAMVLFGASTFVWVLAPRPLAVALDGWHWRLTRAATLTLALTTVLWLMLEAGSMGEGWVDALRYATIFAVISDTEFGRAWQLHGLAVICLLAASLLRRRLTTYAASGLALASLGLIGHAAMHPGVSGALHRANLALHLLSGGFWLGALVPFLASMRLAREPALRSHAIVALQRFSTVGHVAVATVILTGGANAVLIRRADLGDIASSYGVLLLSKMVVVATMAGLSMVNRYWLVPSLRRRAGVASALVRNSIFEIALGSLAVGLVSIFGLLDPARSENQP